jgi:shikimate dehydrogenase
MTETTPLSIDYYAVLGNPIEHSKSPLIHAAFAKQAGHTIAYERILTPLNGFKNTVYTLIQKGYQGVNVTVPFKFEAYALCDIKSAHAYTAGAVNTLMFQHGKIYGHNTDGGGLVNDIKQNLNYQIKGKRILLLGAGGASQGVFQSLVDQSPALIVVANRTKIKAEQLVKKYVHYAHLCVACSFEELSHQQFDLIINATSTGLTNAALPITDDLFANNALAYDMMYGHETPFMKQAKRSGATVADGLGMLIEQAALAYHVWRNVKPNTQLIIEQFRGKKSD